MNKHPPPINVLATAVYLINAVGSRWGRSHFRQTRALDNRADHQGILITAGFSLFRDLSEDSSVLK